MKDVRMRNAEMLSQEMYDALQNGIYGEYSVIEQIRRDVARVQRAAKIYTEARAYMGMLLSTVYAAMLLAAREEERHFGVMYYLLAHPGDVLDLFFEDVAEDSEDEYPALTDFMRHNWNLFQQRPAADTEYDAEKQPDDKLRELAPVCVYTLIDYAARVRNKQRQ
jgi:hypothetical protein